MPPIRSSWAWPVDQLADSASARCSSAGNANVIEARSWAESVSSAVIEDLMLLVLPRHGANQPAGVG